MSPSAVVDDSERGGVDGPEPGGKSLPDTSTPDEKEPSARPTGRSAPPVTSKDTSKDTPPPVNKDNASSPNQPYSSGLQHMVGTGWSAMARIVREVDEQKIQGYKEDIDSILVFAGLFSAVMTAFLVESYHNLSQDPTQVMIFLMQQVASQTHSYTFNGAFLNSTAPPFAPNLPDFQPTVNAIRVNVLWFASLTLSLVSASFSILVKQWLREYLAGEYTSPQARLRIRHFRNPGLEHWKVFEIAAVIPLLLQLSLALFLIGLCFFTLDVHNSVGYTTLPLVAGWAFLFIAASFAPALSPRCPYKLTLLKAVMRTVRKYIFRAVLWAKDVSHRAAEPLTQIPDKWSYKNLAYDEEVAVLTDSNDIDILVSVDSIQSDEQLLSVMWGAVQQTQLGPAESFTFVMQILAHRMQRDINSLLSSPTYLDLRRLPKQTITAVMLMISDLLRAEINHQSPTNTQSLIEWSPWMKDCIFILLSETGSPLPPAADDTLSLLLVFQNRYRPLFNIIRTRIPDTDTLPHVLDRLRGAFMQQNSSMLYGLYSIFEHYFCTNHATDVSMHRRLSDLVKDHPEITHIHIRPLVEITVSSLLGQMRVEMYWHPWLIERIMHVLEMPRHPSYRSTVVKLMQSMLLLYGAVPLCCRFPMGLNWRKEYRGYAQELFIEAVVDVSVSECYSIIYNVTRSLSWQWKQQLDANDNGWARVTRMDPLETSYMVIRALKQATEAKKTTLEKHWIIVRDTLEILEGGLKRVADMHIPDHPDIARRCLQLIDTLDRTRQPLKEGSDENAFGAWARRFRLDRTWFPDVFVKSLALFLPAGQEPTSYRLRRLRFLDLQRTSDVNVERIDRSVVDSPGSVAISRSASRASSDLSHLSPPADSNGTRDDYSEILSPAARDSTEQLTPRGNRFAMSRTSADPDEAAQHPDNDSFVIDRPYYTLIEG